jgi:fibronectin type 3 domain-containing protein
LNANAYADSAVSANTIYRYRVSAFNGSGTSTYSNIAETTTPPQTTQTDSVAIQRAYYNSSKRLLQVEATSTASTAELNVYITSSGAYVGTLGENGRGRYRGSFSLLSNPQNITVRSSLGGTTSKTISLR